jgi:hypothetical protein
LPATLVAAKGDLIAGSAANAADNLSVGSNGTVLTADSAESLESNGLQHFHRRLATQVNS